MIYKSSFAYSFSGKSQRSSIIPTNHSIIPPVGTYIKNILDIPSKGYHFSHTPKFLSNRPKTPGPGHYNIKETFGDAPKYSINKNDKITAMQKHIKIKTREKTPGPGKYNNTSENYNKTIGKSIISKKFSKLKKFQSSNNNIPGPGSYNTKSSKDFGNSIKYSIGKSNRSEIIDKSKLNSSTKNKNDIKALDPGYYNIKENFGNVSFYHKISIRGKPKNLHTNKTPGPGEYDTIKSKERTLKTEPKFSMTKSNRSNIINIKNNNINLGPGKYKKINKFDKNNKSFTFSKSQRMKNIRSKTPGPGFYNIPSSFAVTPNYVGIKNEFRNI